jgi:hypothetical protein
MHSGAKMPHSDLLENLVLVDIVEGGEDEKDKTPIQLLGLPEKEFHRVTASSASPSDESEFDGTGTRLYSGAKAFIRFSRTFPKIFDDCDIIELGAGIGACGLLLAKQQTTKGRVVVTDGEPVTVEIAKQNRELLFGLKPEECNHDSKLVHCQLLKWSEIPDQVIEQLSDVPSRVASISEGPTFKYVIGTDLLYFKTDVKALVATALALLGNSEKEQGAIFLPALIRAAALGERLVELAAIHSLEISTLNIRQFTAEEHLESMVGWYNIHFLVLTRIGASLHPELEAAFTRCRKRVFDPSASDEYDSSDAGDY